MGRDKHGWKRAVFLDRDGVINRNVWNPSAAQYESPLTADAFELLPGVLRALADLQRAGFLLFIVSNQPNYAKGKSTIDAPAAIHRRLLALTAKAEIKFTACYYCFHHPRGRIPAYSGPCICRKPSPYFLYRAQWDFKVNLTRSWMIGDRASDVDCGRSAGTRTIFIRDRRTKERCAHADYAVPNLARAASIIRHDAKPAVQCLERVAHLGSGTGFGVAPSRG